MVEYIETPKKKGREELLRVVVEKVGDIYQVYEDIQTNWPFGIKTKRREYECHTVCYGDSDLVWITTYNNLNEAREVAEELERNWRKK